MFRSLLTLIEPRRPHVMHLGSNLFLFVVSDLILDEFLSRWVLKSVGLKRSLNLLNAFFAWKSMGLGSEILWADEFAKNHISVVCRSTDGLMMSFLNHIKKQRIAMAAASM